VLGSRLHNRHNQPPPRAINNPNYGTNNRIAHLRRSATQDESADRRSDNRRRGSLLTIIIVTPNFETLPAYLFAVFVVFYVSAYSSLTSGRVAYAGKQIGTTFALVFTGLSPSVDIYGPLWRIWGILLGTFLEAIVAFILWPEYAGDSLLPRLRNVIGDTLALAPGGSAASTEDEIQQVNSETMRILAEILGVANDAQVEGRAGLVDHNSIVEAAGTLRRIANRLSSIATGRIVAPRLNWIRRRSRRGRRSSPRLAGGFSRGSTSLVALGA
jgi:hypothetical protein